MKALLVLKDGTVYTGSASGTRGVYVGEVVVNTKMVGYDQVITDPAYFGQLVVMTYPLIGNYGINFNDLESKTCRLAGLILDRRSRIYSNWRAEEDLATFLEEQGVPFLTGVDTRALALKLRETGPQLGAIVCGDMDVAEVLDQLRTQPVSAGSALDVTCAEAYQYAPGIGNPYHVVVLDLGVTNSQLRQLRELGLRVTVVPAGTSGADIRRLAPHGVFLSSGPGSPQQIPAVVGTVRELLPYLPIFGVGLGHLVLGSALGMETQPLTVPHRGANYPVKELSTGKLAITEQNHGYVLDQKSVPPDVTVSHVNLVDETIEGIVSKDYQAFGVQYTPVYIEGDVSPEFRKFYAMLVNSVGAREGCDTNAQTD
ncbi:MAG TPA: glutamine-hydrolyzing carbamoyl-phosphate synthase small subunit [Firmicutes bacterium]|nr:glutamine-hydrolyzing carbamoyl-phosphate synthase small subunit [Bacillota bacterium]